MKTLSKEELIEINGGGSTQYISISSTTASLLNLRLEGNNGDKHRVTEISLGNNIDFNFGLLGKST